MATFRMPIINAHTMPDTNGTAYFDTSANTDSNDRYLHFNIVFSSQSARHGLGGKFTVPKNYVGTPKIIVVWRTTATSGDVVYDIDYTAVGGDAAESMDPSADQESLTVTDTASATARQRQECSMTMTGGNLAADDEVLFNFYRDAVDAADTLAASAWVENILFEYADA